MIVHIVMWRLQDDNKGGHAQELKRRLESLKSTIPSIRHIEAGINIVENDPAASDVVLYSEFDSPADLQAYQAHPDHQAVVDFLNTVRTEKRVVDYMR